MARKVKGVKHLGNGTFLIDYQHDLKRFQERVHAPSIQAARIIREERRLELSKQTNGHTNGNDRLNSSFADAWLKLEGDLVSDSLPLKNVQRYERIYNILFQEFLPSKFPEIKSPSQLRLPVLLEYKSFFVDELKRNPHGGWKSELIVIKSLIRRLKRLGYCTKEFVEELDEMRRPNSEKKDFPDIENSRLSKLFNFIKQDRPAYYYPLMFILLTGRRIQESLCIEKSNIEWNGIIPTAVNIRPKTTKTKNRETPLTLLSEELGQIIRQSSQRNPDSKYLFSGSESHRCKYDRVFYYLKKASKSILGAELTISPHYFRHRFMTQCGKARVPFADVQAISGIKDIKVMQKYYAHATPSGHKSVFAATEL